MSELNGPTDGSQGSSAAGESRSPGSRGRRAGGAPARAIANSGVTHHLSAPPTLSMRAFTSQVEAVLDDLDESARRRAALLASELIAQVIGRQRSTGGEPAGLTIEVQEDAIRLTATGPRPPSVQATADPQTVPADPLADWGGYILDTLADRWGVSGGVGPIWAEIDVPASPSAE